MTWWNKKSKPVDDVILLPEKPEPGTKVECDNPSAVVIVPDPEPDLSTKPPDKIGYCFGYVCPKKHVNEVFENITVDGYKERRACPKCGGVARPAVVCRIAEAKWGDRSYRDIFGNEPDPDWGWYNTSSRYVPRALNWGNPIWTKYEFVHFLDEPKKTVRKKK